MAGRAADPDRIALGFTMQFAFAAVRTAGEISVCKWGCHLRRLSIRPAISYARFSAYHGYAGVTAVPDIYGHLWLISLLVDTFHTLPIGANR